MCWFQSGRVKVFALQLFDCIGRLAETTNGHMGFTPSAQPLSEEHIVCNAMHLLCTSFAIILQSSFGRGALLRCGCVESLSTLVA